MLALPLQRGAVVDSTPLISFLKSRFGPGSDLEDKNDQRSLEKLRQHATAVTEASGDAGLDPLSYAIFQLRSLASRFSEYEDETKLLFSYQDAFKPTKSIINRSIYYDLSTFLWNSAALHSQIGSRVDRSTDDGIRAANRHFQSAAGALDWICSNCSQHMRDDGTLGPISVPVLRMMIMLMLAQAQLCFYEKAVRDRKAGLMKSVIVAKLASQTSQFYRWSEGLSKQEICASYIDASWSNHTDFQSKCFAAAAEYWQSQSAREDAQKNGSGYGEEIARLMRAAGLLKEAIDFAILKKLGMSLTNGAAALQRTVETAKASAENDNSKIYMEPIPPDHTIAAVSQVAMAKPLPFADYTGDLIELGRIRCDTLSSAAC